MRITGQDASKWPPAERRSYDRVLVDTPCSSERHLARSCAQGRPLLREDWSPSRSKRNGDAQLAILLSVRVLIIGRLLVCALFLTGWLLGESVHCVCFGSAVEHGMCMLMNATAHKRPHTRTHAHMQCTHIVKLFTAL